MYATLGTVYDGTDLLTAIIEGLQQEDLNLVVTVGATQDPARFGPRPPTSASSGGSANRCSCRTARPS